MACAGCERRRQAMKEMISKGLAHAQRLAGLRKGDTDGEAPNSPTQDSTGTGARKRSAIRGSAEDPKPAHRKRRVAKAPRGGAGA